MITVWGGQISRSIRVVWVLEEMGLPYRVRQVDMLAAEQDPEFLAVNPANYIPAIQDGDVVMVRRSLLEPSWRGDTYVTSIDFCSEMLGLAALLVGADFFPTYAAHNFSALTRAAPEWA